MCRLCEGRERGRKWVCQSVGYVKGRERERVGGYVCIAVWKEETERGTECMGVCVGYVKGGERTESVGMCVGYVNGGERGTEWVCVCRLCESKRKRDIVDVFV